MTILVLGAAGQLGQAMMRSWSSGDRVIGRSRAELDISRERDVRAAVDATRPDVVVNCAAYTNVDRSQDEPLDALAVNAWGPLYIARAARAIGATVVHFSTDFVFDGETSRPYDEHDAP